MINTCLHVAYPLDNAHATAHPAKYGVLAVQVLADIQGDKELTAIGVGSSIRHACVPHLQCHDAELMRRVKQVVHEEKSLTQNACACVMQVWVDLVLRMGMTVDEKVILHLLLANQERSYTAPHLELATPHALSSPARARGIAALDHEVCDDPVQLQRQCQSDSGRDRQCKCEKAEKGRVLTTVLS